MIELDEQHIPGMFRRLAALAYDLLVMAGVLIVAAALVVIPLGIGYGIKIQGTNTLYQAYLATTVFVFFGWFWVHGGQTPGMRAWRIRLVRDNGDPVRWRDALLRVLTAILSWAPLGLGFLWLLFDRERLTWHDRLSHTRPVMIDG